MSPNVLCMKVLMFMRCRVLSCLQDLVSEKLSVQQQSVDLERLNGELEKMGLNQEKLLQQEHTLEDRSVSYAGPILGLLVTSQ